jgi:hypothetical protein
VLSQRRLARWELSERSTSRTSRYDRLTILPSHIHHDTRLRYGILSVKDTIDIGVLWRSIGLMWRCSYQDELHHSPGAFDTHSTEGIYSFQLPDSC